VKRLLPLVLLVGCAGDLDPQWQLDHDRIVALRAEPPGIAAGEQSVLSGLISLKDVGTMELAPEAAIVASPQALASAVSFDGTSWIVTAPSEDQIAAARNELKLAPGAPVPLIIGVSYAQQTLLATKTVTIGMTLQNPQLGDVLIAGAPAPDADVVVPATGSVALSTAIDNVTEDINWLTSVGEMHDFDLSDATLTLAADDDRSAGSLAVVVRDDHGGATWRVWPITKQ
jgi:hypothetical protein